MKAAALIALLSMGCEMPGDDPRFEVVFGPPEALLPPSAGEWDPMGTTDVMRGPDGDSLLVVEPYERRILRVRGCPDACSDEVLADDVGRPVRAEVVDLDGDGDEDVLVADIGVLYSTETRKGRVLLLRNDGHGGFNTEVLAEGLGRLACVESGDVDGDGDLDVVACVFGHFSGGVVWLEQGPGEAWPARTLDDVAGVMGVVIFDADADGDMDVAAAIAQEAEEVVLYRNQGNAQFGREVLFIAPDGCWGHSGLLGVDIDADGDTDLLATTGDIMDPICLTMAHARRHGLSLYVNDGGGQFERSERASLFGAYALQAADLDADGDLDLVMGAFDDPVYGLPMDDADLVWLENDGEGQLSPHSVADAPSGIISLAVTDVDDDGIPDVVAGSMETTLANPRARRLTLHRVGRVPR